MSKKGKRRTEILTTLKKIISFWWLNWTWKFPRGFRNRLVLLHPVDYLPHIRGEIGNFSCRLPEVSLKFLSRRQTAEPNFRKYKSTHAFPTLRWHWLIVTYLSPHLSRHLQIFWCKFVDHIVRLLCNFTHSLIRPRQTYLVFILNLVKPLVTLINWSSCEVGGGGGGFRGERKKSQKAIVMWLIFTFGLICHTNARVFWCFCLFQARFYKHLCVNVVSGLGFGNGGLEFRGSIHRVPFVLNPNDNGRIHIFPFHQVRDELTFDWLKANVLCEDHPWICIKYPPTT